MTRLYSGFLAVLWTLAAAAWAAPGRAQAQEGDVDSNQVFVSVKARLADLQRYRRQNQYDSAMQVAYGIYSDLQPYKQNPLYVEGAYQYGDLARSLRRYDDGIATLREGIRYAPDAVWRSRLYNRAAALFYEQGRLDSTVAYAQASIATAPIGHRELTFSNHWLLGALYNARGYYPDAAIELRTALRLAEPSDRDNFSTILTHLGVALQALGQHKQALDTLALAIQEANSYGTLPQQSHATGEYAKALLRAGRTEQGIRMMNRFQTIRDSFRLSEKNNTLALLEARDLINRQRATNAELQQTTEQHLESQRRLLIGGIAAALLAATLAVFLYTSRRQQALIRSRNLALHQTQAELESQRDALERLNASKDALLSVVSHDVRGPLLTLGTTLRLLAEGHLDENETRIILDGLAERVQDTETLLNDVLLWTKGHMTGLTADPAVMNPEGMVQEVLQQSRPLLQTHKVDVEVEGSPTPLLADEGLLKVVIRNLLSNAIRYGGPMGQVTVRYCQTATEAGIAIADRGNGMPAELVQRLTSPQADNLPTRAMLSLGGLGLILVKDFVLRQNGRIAVTSTTRGTAITVWMPRPAFAPATTPVLVEAPSLS